MRLPSIPSQYRRYGAALCYHARVYDSSHPLVSVVILSYNCADLLPRAIASIHAQRYDAVELIVVDNASTDGTLDALDTIERAAPTLVFRQAENIGFARGINTGYAAAHGDYLIFLNCDVVLRPDFIANAVDLFARHPDVGVIGANVWRIARDGGVDEWRFWEAPAPHGLPFDGGVVALDRGLHVLGLTDGGVPWQTSFKANGACPVVRRALLDQMERRFGVAPFDPVFDTYGEDVDFAFKAWALRWRTMFAATVVAGHVRSYASELHLWDKRGRLRVNLIAERYINALRYLPPARLLSVLASSLWTDTTKATRRRLGGDRTAYRDLGAALWRVVGLWPALTRFRRAHHAWTRIDYAHEVFLIDAPGVPME
jgi:GT2 family glycosyltransferase